MDEYYLFLDESKPLSGLKYFCLAGCIIEKNVYINEIIPKVQLLKQEIFSNTNIILHEVDLRKAEKCEYKILMNKAKRDKFWIETYDILKNCQLTTMGACVNDVQTKSLYPEKFLNSCEYITLQIILENFVHFLEKANAKGNIILESVNTTEDSRLTNFYYSILSRGTLFLQSKIFQKHLGTINHYIKADNNIGLQLADLIPNPINREFSQLKQKQYSLLDIINEKSYDGGIGLKDKFGIKKIE